MMGQLSSGQERLFYSFNLEDHIQPITSCAALIDALISAICAIISPIFIAQSGTHRLILN